MSLTHPEYLPYLGHTSVIITFVFVLGTISLIFGALNKGGSGSGGGSGKKDAHGKGDHGAPSGPEDNPTNFFDGTTAALVNATASPDDAEPARVPTNFFDSTTQALLGKESAEQLKEYDALQNPHNFFDNFASSVMGLQGSPQTPGEVVNSGSDTPQLPSQQNVPFMSGGVVAGNAAEGNSKVEAGEKKNGTENGENKNGIESRRELQAKLLNLGAFESAKKIAQEYHAKPNEGGKSNGGEDAKGAAVMMRAQLEAAKDAKDSAGRMIHFIKNREKPNANFAPEKDLGEAIKALTGIIKEMSKLKIYDEDTRTVFKEIIKFLEDNDKKGKKISKEVKEALMKVLSAKELQMLEEILEHKEDGDNNGGEGKDKGDAASKKEAINSVRQNLDQDKLKDFDKALVLISSKCANLPGLKPADLVAQNYGWNYARAC